MKTLKLIGLMLAYLAAVVIFLLGVLWLEGCLLESEHGIL